ncbi:conserved hypothetical protein [Desulfamplus magnetovallimortis]|uniref:Putative restriction endonuclease domain-containing protein n=1 Tax=Desulfamplus magnetovallimortis TaxID=1246637 RepID=A0A1W1H8X0_9BACT|nr:Uma2 family endonuclease [Desulfamplus magnetovallimortis]SLM28818.1 conserved hypothetical protein [Desulfamplus magnetovallimortis]
MNAQPQKIISVTPEEYLEFERNSGIRHEYFEGEIFAMVGARKNHNLINTNIIMELGSKLKASGSFCKVFSNDMRVKVQENGKYTYPDIAVACNKIDFEDDKLDTLLNPVVIFEILSNSTEAYDRGIKFQHYQLIPSLQEYILVSQYNSIAEVYSRGKDGSWQYTAKTEMAQVIKIKSINCELSLSDIYWDIKF